ncbi:MAG: alpha-L-fucosidase [Acidobacteria bacterium]|nr:alpha-L-fucosidase [Acidobacteriota bacterium]
MNRRTVGLVLVGWAGVALTSAAGDEAELRARWREMHEAKAEQLVAFNEAKFGMFIHWGLYAIPAGEWKGERMPGISEWIMQRAKIPRDEYAALAKQFNPVKFDADAWVRIALDAGMRYMVITSKHHDGFAMYDSDVSDYNVVDATPFGRDVVAELHAACKRQGLRFGVYHSHSIDWYDGGDGGFALSGSEGRSWPVNLHDPSPTSFPDYVEKKAKPQVREILTKYPDLWTIWYDVPFRMDLQTSFDFYKMTYDLQPATLAGHRVGNDLGDYIVPGDNRIPEDGVTYDRPWETVGTLNNSWGYKHFDNDWKSVEELLFWIVEIASKGGNYMLNVGPTAEGLIPEESVVRLHAVGDWMKRNGEAVYGTERWRTTHEGPATVAMGGTREREEKGFEARFTPQDIWYTRKDATVYAMALVPPDGNQIVLSALASDAPEQVEVVRVLGTGTPAPWSRDETGLKVVLPDGSAGERGYALAIDLEQP